MPITIGQRTDHGFDAPLGLLSDCHRRIERFLFALVTIARTRRGGALDAGDRQALEAALRYFSTAAPRHSADEEESLFPRLKKSDDADVQSALAVLERLEADHRVADAHHAEVDTIARHWLSAGELTPQQTETLIGHLTALEELYRGHIAVEDRDLFPAAGRALSAEELEDVGREMAARRNVPFRPPSLGGDAA
jgi:hemerythrin-like domain-containing protein